VQPVPAVVVVRVPTGQLRQVTQIRELLSRLRAVLLRSAQLRGDVVVVATRTHEGISRLALRRAALGAHAFRAATSGVTRTGVPQTRVSQTDSDDSQARAATSPTTSVRSEGRSDGTGRHRHEDGDRGPMQHRAQHARGHGRHL
jgi:hypothetical protein